ncbi:hypothetical protein PF003_g2717 [Phytophthora fragariae]|nr:hypothetical protein PF003_g2717 [Phytophthora fragariae]
MRNWPAIFAANHARAAIRARRSFPRAQSQTSFPKSPATAPARFPNYAVARLASTVAAKVATKLLILNLAAAMLAVLLSPMPAAAMLVVLPSLSPLLLRSP